MRCYRTYGAGGWESVLDVQFLFFLLKKIGFAPWLSIMLSQTLIYYWQEIFTFTLTSDSEAILYWYHCIVCGLIEPIKRVVSFNVTWLSFVFVLINFILDSCTHKSITLQGGGGSSLLLWNWTSKVKRMEEFWMLIGQFPWTSYV